MKINFSIFLLLILASCSVVDKKNDDSIDSKVEKLLSRMTLEEKVGQMNQLTLDVFYADTLNEEKLKEYIIKYGVGSILNAPVMHKKTEAIPLKEWRRIVTTVQEYAMQTRLKIPVLYGVDAIHGTTYLTGATLFPHNIGMAATRNPSLVKRAAELTAQEVRACGVTWNFDPVVGVARQPLWPRFEETFGEDYYLVGEMGSAAIKGYEEKGLGNTKAVASCMKHYIGYPASITGKDRTPAFISERELRQRYLPPFRKAVEAGTSTVMVSSSSINEIPTHANKFLLTDVLRDELGFDGVIVTDWLDIIWLKDEHHIAKDNKMAVKKAIEAGIDLSMVPFDLSFYNDLISLVKDGEISESRIDESVRRILKLKFQLGLFDNPFPSEDTKDFVETKEYKKVALEAAQKSITLLKNDTINNKPVLPLGKNSKLLLAGPAVNSLPALHGSWSYSWQATDVKLYPNNIKNIGEAIRGIAEKNIINIADDTFGIISNNQIMKLKRKAHNVDAIVLCLGETSYAESLGNIDDLTLSADQLKLAEVAIGTGKPVVLVLTEGRPRVISKIEPGMSAILQAYRPGNMGAEAIADILFGNVNPSGKLPYSYPRFTGNIVPYDMPARIEKYYKPQWEFGYGLSYSKFTVTSLILNTDTLNIDDTLNITITVKNESEIDGTYTQDLFVKDYYASVTPSIKSLKRFVSIPVKAGETKTIEFKLEKADWQFIGKDLKPTTEPGKMAVIFDNIQKDFYLTE